MSVVFLLSLIAVLHIGYNRFGTSDGVESEICEAYMFDVEFTKVTVAGFLGECRYIASGLLCW